jgi:dihydrofolate reductase
MQVSLIVAMDRHGLIGTEHGLPWHLPADLRRFRSLTMGKPIIMGRKTREQIGKTLPGRRNIVLSRSSDTSFPGCTVVGALQQALEIAERDSVEAFIIGGAEVYRQALPLCGRIHLTIVDGSFSGSVHFPVDAVKPGEWAASSHELIEREDRNPHPHAYLELVRKSTGDRREWFDLIAALDRLFDRSGNSSISS